MSFDLLLVFDVELGSLRRTSNLDCSTPVNYDRVQLLS